MAASLTDKLMYVGNEGTLTSLQSPGKALAASSITIGSGSNWPSATGFIMAIRTVDSSGIEVANTYTEWIATYSGSGTAVTINPVPVTGSDQVYTAGTNTQVFIPVAAKRENLLVDWGLAQHNQDGSHKSLTTDTLTATGVVTASSFVQTGGAASNGWTVGLAAPTTVTALGNRSYQFAWTGNDYSTTLSPGFRGRTTRAAAGSTQCMAFTAASTQYATKTSPTGMGTSWTAFTVEFNMYLNSYTGTDQMVVGRTDTGATNGWYTQIKADGTFQITYVNAGNATVFKTNQTVPLKKWVHIAGVITSTASKTGIVYFDYLPVPTSSSTAAATSMGTQTGNFTIGRWDSPGQYLDAYLSEVRVWSVAQSAAQILANGPIYTTGLESNLVGAWQGNGNFNDKTTNANNLTATGAIATQAAAPSGTQADGSISASLDYLIFQKVSVSGGNTTAIVQAPEGCTIATGTSPLSAVAYSSNEAPYGFPKQKTKWRIACVMFADTGNISVGSLNNAQDTGYWITAPIGEWELSSKYMASQSGTTAANIVFRTFLNTTNSISVGALNAVRLGTGAASSSWDVYTNGSTLISVASQTLYKLYFDSESGGGSITYRFYNSAVSGATDYGIFLDNTYL